MSCVHYKFKSQQDYDTLTFDGLHISVADLKRAIKDKNKMMVGLSDSDLQITDAQSKKVFEHDKDLIQRNSSVIVARVPLQSQSKIRLPKFTNQKGGAPAQPGIVITRKGAAATAEAGSSSTKSLAETANVASSDMDEESKLKQIRDVSTRDYDPKNFPRANRSMFFGKPPPTYLCNICKKTGHWINQCPLRDTRKATGIPHEELVEATPDDPHAMVTATGRHVKHIMHVQARAQGKIERPPNWDDENVTTHVVDLEPEAAVEIPDELKCALCTELMREAVLIQCCGNSFCDECIRNNLLDSESKECPVCHKVDMSPEELVPNQQLRRAVTKFLNDTGYAHYAKRRFAAEDLAGSRGSPVDGSGMSPYVAHEYQQSPNQSDGLSAVPMMTSVASSIPAPTVSLLSSSTPVMMPGPSGLVSASAGTSTQPQSAAPAADSKPSDSFSLPASTSEPPAIATTGPAQLPSVVQPQSNLSMPPPGVNTPPTYTVPPPVIISTNPPVAQPPPPGFTVPPPGMAASRPYAPNNAPPLLTEEEFYLKKWQLKTEQHGGEKDALAERFDALINRPQRRKKSASRSGASSASGSSSPSTRSRSPRSRSRSRSRSRHRRRSYSRERHRRRQSPRNRRRSSRSRSRERARRYHGDHVSVSRHNELAAHYFPPPGAPHHPVFPTGPPMVPPPQTFVDPYGNPVPAVPMYPYATYVAPAPAPVNIYEQPIFGPAPPPYSQVVDFISGKRPLSHRRYHGDSSPHSSTHHRRPSDSAYRWTKDSKNTEKTELEAKGAKTADEAEAKAVAGKENTPKAKTGADASPDKKKDVPKTKPTKHRESSGKRSSTKDSKERTRKESSNKTESVGTAEVALEKPVEKPLTMVGELSSIAAPHLKPEATKSIAAPGADDAAAVGKPLDVDADERKEKSKKKKEKKEKKKRRKSAADGADGVAIEEDADAGKEKKPKKPKKSRVKSDSTVPGAPESAATKSESRSEPNSPAKRRASSTSNLFPKSKWDSDETGDGGISAAAGHESESSASRSRSAQKPISAEILQHAERAYYEKLPKLSSVSTGGRISPDDDETVNKTETADVGRSTSTDHKSQSVAQQSKQEKSVESSSSRNRSRQESDRHGSRQESDRHGSRQESDRHGSRQESDRHGSRQESDRHGSRHESDRHRSRSRDRDRDREDRHKSSHERKRSRSRSFDSESKQSSKRRRTGSGSDNRHDERRKREQESRSKGKDDGDEEFKKPKAPNRRDDEKSTKKPKTTEKSSSTEDSDDDEGKSPRSPAHDGAVESELKKKKKAKKHKKHKKAKKHRKKSAKSEEEEKEEKD